MDGVLRTTPIVVGRSIVEGVRVGEASREIASLVPGLGDEVGRAGFRSGFALGDTLFGMMSDE